MTARGWTLTPDGFAFAEAALEFLARDPVGNTVVLTVAAGLRTSPRAAAAQDCYGWWTGADGRIGAAFAAQHPYAVTLGAEVGEQAADELPGAWQRSGRARPSGVFGGVRTAERIAARWAALLGCGYRLKPHHAMRLFSFDQPTAPDPAPVGASRVAALADVPVLSAWEQEFFHACGLPVRRDLGPLVRARVEDGQQLLWIRDGEPVAAANFTRPAAGTSRITGVFTPPAHRRNGYAAGVTWAATHEALARGAHRVVLHTDVANPVSNAVYQRIGYRPVRDVSEFEFTDLGA